MKLEKRRVSMTFPKPYLDFMTRLVKNGMYFNKGSVMMDALRLLSEKHRILIFPLEEAGD